MKLPVYDACGNVFALLDERGAEPHAEPGELARALDVGFDGLVVVGAAADAGAVASVRFHNRDGGRPEACGNGLRSVAAHLFEHDRARAGSVETDAGPRRFAVEHAAGPVAVVRVTMGRPELRGEADLDLPGGSRRVALVSMGNPHAVLFVDDPGAAPVADLGPAIGAHARFPAGTNVGFCAVGSDGLRLRVWERGVGETGACGTGACAAAAAAEAAGLAAAPVAVAMPGGRLEVGRDGPELTLTGPVRFAGHVELPERAALGGP